MIDLLRTLVEKSKVYKVAVNFRERQKLLLVYNRAYTNRFARQTLNFRMFRYGLLLLIACSVAAFAAEEVIISNKYHFSVLILFYQRLAVIRS